MSPGFTSGMALGAVFAGGIVAMVMGCLASGALATRDRETEALEERTGRLEVLLRRSLPWVEASAVRHDSDRLRDLVVQIRTALIEPAGKGGASGCSITSQGAPGA